MYRHLLPGTTLGERAQYAHDFGRRMLPTVDTDWGRSTADLAALYEWLRAVYARLDALSVRSASASDILAAARGVNEQGAARPNPLVSPGGPS